VAVKNKFLLGDEVEMMTPKGNIVFKIERMLNRKNENVEAGLGDGHFVFLDVPEDVQLDYALLMRNLVNTNTRQPHQK
ncbi:putative protease, partial [Pasteurella multocida subsp. multocida str. Anand1_cattle]